MKYLAVLALIILVAGCGGNSQPETDPAINIPLEQDAGEITDSGVNAPNLTAGIDIAEQSACRANMHAIAASIAMYQVEHGALPSTLEEVMGVAPVCPDGGNYQLVIEDNSWTVSCSAEPSHGSITDGINSW